MVLPLKRNVKVPANLLMFPIAIYSMIAMGEFTIGVILVEIIHEFQITETEAGGLFSAYITLTAMTTFFGGSMSDRFGRKFSLVMGAGIFFFAFVVASFSLNYKMLILAFAFAGIGKGTYAPSIYSLMGELTTSSRGLLIGLATSAFYFGGFLGPVVLGALATLFGWRIPLRLLGVAGLLVVVALIIFAKERKKTSAKEKALFVRGSFRDVFKTRNGILVCMTIFVSSFGFGAHISWTPTFLQRAQNLDIASAGLIYGLFFFAGILGSLILSSLSDRIGRKVPIILVGFISAVSSYILYLSFHPFDILAILMLVFGFFAAPFWALQTVLAQESVRPELIGTATGMVQGIGYSSAIVAPLIVGQIISTSSVMSMTMILGVSLPYLICGIMILAYRQVRNQDRVSAL